MGPNCLAISATGHASGDGVNVSGCDSLTGFGHPEACTPS
jgi:hypothetical protein